MEKPLDTLKGFQEGEALVLYARTERPFSYGLTSRFSFGGHGQLVHESVVERDLIRRFRTRTPVGDQRS